MLQNKDTPICVRLATTLSAVRTGMNFRVSKELLGALHKASVK